MKKPIVKTKKKALPKAQVGETIKGFAHDFAKSHKKRVKQVKDAIYNTAMNIGQKLLENSNAYDNLGFKKRKEMYDEALKKKELKTLEENRKIGFAFAKQKAEADRKKKAEANKKKKAKPGKKSKLKVKL
jgi:hypothetical protein